MNSFRSGRPALKGRALGTCLAIAFFLAVSGASARLSAAEPVQQANQPPIEDIQAAAAEFLSKQLPFQVDEVTTLESVANAGPMLIYNYRLTVLKESLDVPTFRVEMRRTLKQTACAQKDMRKIMSIGGSYRYVYLGADGHMIDEVTIGSSDC